MRLIGEFQEESSARVFSDYLYVQGIKNDLERDGGRWNVWVHGEDQIDRSRGYLKEFLVNPADAKFSKASTAAADLQTRERKENEAYKKRVRTADQIFPRVGLGIVTLLLMAVSIWVSLITELGTQREKLAPFLISEYVRGYREIEAGQVWRIVTPIFLHFGLSHILFNMWGLKSMGSAIESFQGSLRFLGLVLVIAVVSNLAQRQAGSPFFGGMSGVVYGLFGYIWVRSHFDPAFPLALDQLTVVLMIGWFFFCMTPMIGIPIANWAHGAGLGTGMFFGYVAAWWRNR